MKSLENTLNYSVFKSTVLHCTFIHVRHLTIVDKKLSNRYKFYSNIQFSRAVSFLKTYHSHFHRNVVVCWISSFLRVQYNWNSHSFCYKGTTNINLERNYGFNSGYLFIKAISEQPGIQKDILKPHLVCWFSGY